MYGGGAEPGSARPNWAAPGADRSPRPTLRPSADAGRCRSSPPRDRLPTAPASSRSWKASASAAPSAARAPGPTLSPPTRRTPPAPTALACGDAASAVSSRRRPTKPPTARRRARVAAARSGTIRTSTRTATPSSAASARSRSGGAWLPATTRPPPATSPDSTYAAASSGSAVSDPPHDPNLEQSQGREDVNRPGLGSGRPCGARAGGGWAPR